MAHGEDEVGNGSGVWVHEAKTPLGNCDVGNEERREGDGISLGEPGEKVRDHCVDAAGEWAFPGVPAFVASVSEGVHDF